MNPSYVPLHGVDYLQDHYAVLGIARDADEKQIKDAYHDLAKQYHPDVVARAASEIQKDAERKFKVIDFAYQTLSNPEARSAYDRQLANFDPQLISTSGVPILRLGARRIDLDYLVGSSDTQRTERNQQLLEQAKTLSGHNDTVFGVIEQQYQAAASTGTPSADLRTAYREVLHKKNAFLSLAEELTWSTAGIENQPDTKVLGYPEDHLAQRQEHLAEAQQNIAERVQTRVLALSAGLAPLLLISGSEEKKGEDALQDAEKLQERLTAHAQQQFSSHQERIMDIAQERSEVLEALTELTEWEYLPKEQQLQPQLLMILEGQGKVLGYMGCVFNGDQLQYVPGDEYNLPKEVPLDSILSRGEELQQIRSSGCSLAVVHLDPQFDHFLQINHVATQHIEKVKSLQEQAKKASP